MFKISSAATSNAGKKKINEDNFYMNGLYIADNNASSGKIYSDNDNMQHNIQFYAVFDGLGEDIKSDINPNMDFFEGETASFAAADMLSRLQRYLAKEERNISESVFRFVRITNKNICEYIKQKNFRTGASFALLCIHGSAAYIYNIGNSKIFLFRENRLVLISQNDTKAESMVLAKQISADIVKHTPDNKILTQYLGMFENEKNLDLHVNRLNLRNGDKFLICTDGLCDLPNERIYQIMSRDMSEQEIVTDLINESMRNGESSGENVTAVVVGVNNSDETSNKANLLKPAADGTTHFSPIIFRNKFELKPKHIRQIILGLGVVVIFIVLISMLFHAIFKPTDSTPTGEPQNTSDNQPSGQEPTGTSDNTGATGNFVITTETTTFDITTYDPYETEEETTEATTRAPDTTTPTTAAPVVTTNAPTTAPPTEPPVTEPPEQTDSPATTEAPTETPTDAPTTAEPVTEEPTDPPTTEEPTEAETDPPTEAPTEPPAETEPETVPETDPPVVEEETIGPE